LIMDWEALTADDVSGLEAAGRFDGNHRMSAVLAAARRLMPDCDSPGELSWCENATRLLLEAWVTNDVDAILLLQGFVRDQYAKIGVGSGTASSSADVWRRAGRLEQLAETARLAMEQMMPRAAVAAVEPGSLLEQFILTVGQFPRSSGIDIAGRMRDSRGKAPDAAIVSRLGQRAISQGLVDVVRAGRRSSWELTARGQYVCQGLLHRRIEGQSSSPERWPETRTVLYSPASGVSISDAITDVGQPDEVEVVLSGGGTVRYEASSTPLDGTDSLDSEVTVEDVSGGGPSKAPERVPTRSRVYDKVPVS